jgi:hypothetical protein
MSKTSTSPSSTSTITTTATVYPTPVASSVDLVDNSCPSDTILTTWGNAQWYRCYAASDMPNGDFTAIQAFSLKTCVDACTVMNTMSGKKTCIAISMDARMSRMYELRGANWWLKGNGTGPVQKTESITVARLCLDPDCNELVDKADPN